MNVRRTLLGPLLAAFAVAGVTACASEQEPESAQTPTETVTETATSKPEPEPEPAAEEPVAEEEGMTDAQIMELAYLAVLREIPEIQADPAATDTALVDLGHTVCEGLDYGSTFEDFHAVIVADGLDAMLAGQIIGAAVPAFCPEYEVDLEDFIARNGG